MDHLRKDALRPHYYYYYYYYYYYSDSDSLFTKLYKKVSRKR